MNHILPILSSKAGNTAGRVFLLSTSTAISDASGNLVESLSYDPCLSQPQGREGRRRNPANYSDYNVTSTMFDRGFTGHEHLPQFGLINMNSLPRQHDESRVYDPFRSRIIKP